MQQQDLEDRMYNEKQSGATLLDRLALLTALENNELSAEPEKPTKQLANEWRATRKKMKVAESTAKPKAKEFGTASWTANGKW